MNKRKSLKALKDSIKAYNNKIDVLSGCVGLYCEYNIWDTSILVNNIVIAFGALTCPLCLSCMNCWGDICCERCPIMVKIGKEECVDSPWLSIIKYVSENKKITKWLITLVKRERDFLQGLYDELKETGKIKPK